MQRQIGPTIEIAASDRLMLRYERELAEGSSKLRKGAVRALRKSIRSGKAAASKEIRDVVNLKKAVVDKRIDARVISQRSLIGKVAVRDRRIELVEFMTPAQVRSAYVRQRARRSKGVPVKAYKTKPRVVYDGTFVEIGTNDRKWHVLKRTTSARYPIHIQYGPNMTDQFEKTLPRFAERMNAVLERNLEHEIDFALGKL